MNVKCSEVEGYSSNFYHFLAQQLQAIYFFHIEHSMCKLNLYYEGPFNSILAKIPFIVVHPLAEVPDNCITIEPIRDYANIKTFAHYLKFIFLPQTSLTQKRYITIIQRSKNRIIKNIDDVIQKVKTLGEVNLIELEKLPFLEQLSVLRNSKLIIMPHGAAMTFCMLLEPSTKIIELYPKYFKVLKYYSHLAKKFNIPHIEMECDSIPGSGNQFTDQADKDDLIYLKTMLNTEKKYDLKDIQTHHRLRGLLRDVKFLTVDLPNFTKLL